MLTKVNWTSEEIWGVSRKLCRRFHVLERHNHDRGRAAKELSWYATFTLLRTIPSESQVFETVLKTYLLDDNEYDDSYICRCGQRLYQFWLQTDANPGQTLKNRYEPGHSQFVILGKLIISFERQRKWSGYFFYISLEISCVSVCRALRWKFEAAVIHFTFRFHGQLLISFFSICLLFVFAFGR